jgi:hypothetical protein
MFAPSFSIIGLIRSRLGKSRKKPTLPKVRSLEHYREQTGRHLASIDIEDPRTRDASI